METLIRETFVLTLMAPREAARRIVGWQLPLSVGWLGLALISVVSALLGNVAMMLSGAEIDPQMAALLGSPMRIAGIQIAVHALTALLIFEVGRRFGGQGRLADALVLTAWVELPLIAVQLAQLVAILLLPGIDALLGLMGFGLYAVLLTLFITELHGFRSPLVVFFGIVATGFVAALVVAILMITLFGMDFQGHV